MSENNHDIILRELSGLGYEANSENDVKRVYDELNNRPALANTTAVKNGDVYLLGADIYSRPGYIVGISYLSKWLYPEVFEDFDSEEVHKEYMELFHPGKRKIKQHGGTKDYWKASPVRVSNVIEYNYKKGMYFKYFLFLLLTIILLITILISLSVGGSSYSADHTEKSPCLPIYVRYFLRCFLWGCPGYHFTN